MRKQATLACSDWSTVQPKVLSWLRSFSHSIYLDSNDNHQNAYHQYDVLIGAGVHALYLPNKDTFGSLHETWKSRQDWWFGFLTYDLKNEIEALSSTHVDGMQWPKAGFFCPEIVIYLKRDVLTIESNTAEPTEIWTAILSQEQVATWKQPTISFQTRMSRNDYLDAVSRLREHIAAGDVYEVNFTQEWYAEGIELDPYSLFQAFDTLGQTPFAGFVTWGDKYLLGQSPERFLAKRGDLLISQPIKGTTRRGRDEEEDRQLAESLLHNEKERAENVMIVDLVRNDLARSAVTGTVEVPELFGIYAFATVHQMISTVTAQLRTDVDWSQAIKHAFPMGSMTGAPKVMAMQLIEQYEKSKRGLYSGAVGYIDPKGDFDFNVVIRSMQYRADLGYLSFQTGGAITWDSDPLAEYEESLLKAAGILQLFTSPQ